MRPILDLEFKELMGRFGNWPTDASIQACEAIVRLAKQCPQGATFVDVGVTTGKTTVCLAHAAYRLGGKVIAVSTQTNQPILAGWFNRAMLLFKTTGYVVNADGASEQADFVVAREGAPMREIYTNGLKPNGVLLVLGANDTSMKNYVSGTETPPLEQGLGYVAWRKEEALASGQLPIFVLDGVRDLGPYEDEATTRIVGDANGVQSNGTVGDDKQPVSEGVHAAGQEGQEQSNETPHDASASENTSRNGEAKSSHKPKASEQKVLSTLTPDKI